MLTKLLFELRDYKNFLQLHTPKVTRIVLSLCLRQEVSHLLVRFALNNSAHHTHVDGVNVLLNNVHGAKETCELLSQTYKLVSRVSGI